MRSEKYFSSQHWNENLSGGSDVSWREGMFASRSSWDSTLWWDESFIFQFEFQSLRSRQAQSCQKHLAASESHRSINPGPPFSRSLALEFCFFCSHFMSGETTMTNVKRAKKNHRSNHISLNYQPTPSLFLFRVFFCKIYFNKIHIYVNMLNGRFATGQTARVHSPKILQRAFII